MPPGKPTQSTARNGQQPIPLVPFPLQPQEQEEFDPKQIISILKRRILVLMGVAITVTGGIWAWSWTRIPMYRAEFRMLVEPISEFSPSRELVQSNQQESGFDYATQMEVLRSPWLLEPIVEQLQRNYPDLNLSYGELVSKLAISQVQDTQSRLTKILIISYSDSDPKRIKLILDTLLEAYKVYGVQLRQLSLSRGVEFVDEQLPTLQQRVNSLQLELERFRKRYSLIDPESRGSQLTGQMQLISQAQKDAQTELAQTQALYTILQQQLGTSPNQALLGSALSESSRYQKLLSQLQDVETQIATESVRFQPESPNIRVLLEKRQSLLPLIEQEARRVLGRSASTDVSGNLAPIAVELSKELVRTTNQLQVLQVRVNALSQVEERLKQEFAIVPSLAREYTDLERRLQVATNSLNRFLATRETLQIQAAQQAIPWLPISKPFEPQVPVSPNTSRNLALGVVAGLLLGVGAALLIEQLDNAFHTPNEIKDLTGLPLLGTIPFKRRLKQANNQSSEYILTNLGSSSFSEALRSLYTNIRFLSSDTPIRSFAISSCVPGEGKSTISLYLAQAAAAMGQRVLLVDADLRHPQIHVRLGLPNLRGLSNAITTDVDLNEVVLQSPIDENLFILTAGQIPPDPLKLLSSRKMQNLAEQFQTSFDLTIYDTPPLLGLADASVLAVRTDGVLLSVGLGKTGRSDLLQVLDTLKLSYVPVLGLIANGVKGYNTGADYYYRYYTPSQGSTRNGRNSAGE